MLICLMKIIYRDDTGVGIDYLLLIAGRESWGD